MPNLSKGYLRARPFRVSTTATLDEIRLALTLDKPDVTALSRGWGAISDDADYVGQVKLMPIPGDPAVLKSSPRGDLVSSALPLHGGTYSSAPSIVGHSQLASVVKSTAPHHRAKGSVKASAVHSPRVVPISYVAPRPTVLPVLPDDLVARYYWWVPDSSLRRYVAAQGNAADWNRLRVADILISPIEGTSDFTLLVTSHNSDDVDTIIRPAIDAALQSIDTGATISVQSVLDLITVDVFLWLVHRQLESIRITGDLKLSHIRNLWVNDPLDQGSHLWRGVNSNRMDLIGYIAESSKSFGPARLVVESDILRAVYDFDLEVTGDINVHVKETIRFDDDQLSTEESRIRLLRDLAYIVVPAIKDAYVADTDWHSSIKPAYRASKKLELQQRAGLL